MIWQMVLRLEKSAKSKMKYFIFKPASQITAKPVNAIKIDVPKSG